MNTKSATVPLIVFYDGACPLCRREIDHYMRRRGAEHITWIDIAENETLDSYGLDRQSAMEVFHVLDNRTWYLGASAFSRIWIRLPAYKWLAMILINLRLIPVLDSVYRKFAAWRIRRRCDNDSCGFTF